MEKILRILHKKLDDNIDKKINLKIKKKKIEKAFSFDKLTYVDKKEFDYFENEIIYFGILTKHKIEKAYKEGRTKMFDYYEVLSYEDKKRLMNYEIGNITKDLSCFIFEDQKIFIPFFDKKMNAIYEKEMVLFDLKQYYQLTLEYEKLMENNIYGYQVYDSSFSSLNLIYVNDKDASLYSDIKKRLYFMHNYKMENFITISNLDNEAYIEISKAYFKKDKEDFIQTLSKYNCIDEKVNKKLLKTIK